jgi:hypothetical protein
MRQTCAFSMIFVAALLHAQDGQNSGRPGWPCVPGRAVDPAYLEISESTGGQLFLFRKNEVAQSALVMNASHTHPATVLRAIGNLSGSRDFEFPVDSAVESLLVLASLQCRNAVLVSRPNGSELSAVNSALSVDLQAGRILRVDQPEAGRWRIRLTGTGLFVLSVLAKADTKLTGVRFSTPSPLLGVPQNVELHLAGQISQPVLQLIDATGNPLSGTGALEETAAGVYSASIAPQAQRFRILITGVDSQALPFQRTWPTLFKAQPPK